MIIQNVVGLLLKNLRLFCNMPEAHSVVESFPTSAWCACYIRPEISGAIVGITLVLAAVFIPMSMAAGSVGAIYRQFTLSMAVSILFSAFLALTLTPALCATILKPAKPIPKAAFSGGSTGDSIAGGFMIIAMPSGMSAIVACAAAISWSTVASRLPQFFRLVKTCAALGPEPENPKPRITRL